MVSPYVEVEVIGADYDNVKHKTKTIHDNGFNPVWEDKEQFELYIQNPELTLLRLYHLAQPSYISIEREFIERGKRSLESKRQPIAPLYLSVLYDDVSTRYLSYVIPFVFVCFADLWHMMSTCLESPTLLASIPFQSNASEQGFVPLTLKMDTVKI